MMSTDDFAAALQELMNAWNERRARWIEMFGTEDGFAEWFKEQMLGKPTH